MDQLRWKLVRIFETLRDLTNRRNEIHDPVNADPAHAAHWLEQVEPLWQKMCHLTEGLL